MFVVPTWKVNLDFMFFVLFINISLNLEGKGWRSQDTARYEVLWRECMSELER